MGNGSPGNDRRSSLIMHYGNMEIIRTWKRSVKTKSGRSWEFPKNVHIVDHFGDVMFGILII
jgi:hypothetical protein